MAQSDLKSFFRGIPIILTLLLGGITIVAASAGTYPPTEAAYMPLLVLCIPILLILNLLTCVVWAVLRKLWCIVPLIAIGFNHEYLSAVIQFNSSLEYPNTYIEGENNGFLKVATYNIHNFGTEITGYSAKEVAQYMQKENVDILCFQEFDNNGYFPMDSILSIFSHWRYQLIPPATEHNILPIAVFSRYPLINEQYITYPESWNCSMQCDALVGQDTIRILNNHLQTTEASRFQKEWKSEFTTYDIRKEAKVMKSAASILHGNLLKRAEQVESIYRLITDSPHPIIVCGDFNSLPTSYVYRKLTSVLQDGFKTRGKGYMYTYRYYKRLLRIDYIFHSPNLEPYQYYSPNLDLCSDHNPVIMGMKIE